MALVIKKNVPTKYYLLKCDADLCWLEWYINKNKERKLIHIMHIIIILMATLYSHKLDLTGRFRLFNLEFREARVQLSIAEKWVRIRNIRISIWDVGADVRKSQILIRKRWTACQKLRTACGMRKLIEYSGEFGVHIWIGRDGTWCSLDVLHLVTSSVLL